MSAAAKTIRQLFGLIRVILFRDLYSLFLFFSFRVKYFWIEWRNLGLIRQFDSVVRTYTNKTAIIYHGQQYSFGDVSNLVNKVAHWTESSLQLGLEQDPVETSCLDDQMEASKSEETQYGDQVYREQVPFAQVGLFLGNIPELPSFMMGLARVRASSVLFNTNHRRDTLVNAFLATNCKVMVLESKYLPVFREVASQLPDIRYFVFNREHPNVFAEPQEVISEESSDYYYNGLSKEDLEKGGTELDQGDKFAKILSQFPVGPVKGYYKYRLSDTINYIFTSGTTGGNIKAAPVNNCRYLVGYISQTQTSGITADDNIYISLPCYHSFPGLLGLGRCLIGGSTVTLADKFSASRFWHDCRINKCTVALYIGETCRYLLAQPVTSDEKNHSIRMMVGLGLKKEIWAEFKKRFNIKHIAEFYGSSEGNVQIYNLQDVEGSCGFLPYYFGILTRFLYPIYLIQVDPVTLEPKRNRNGLCKMAKPGDLGLLVGEIRSGVLFTKFLGYTSSEETSKKLIRNILTKGDFAFSSGDLFEFDFYGNLYFKDRTGDTYRWKGENVSTTEIETIAASILHHRDCIVYGVQVPHCEGRAGMLATTENLDLEVFYHQMKLRVPEYAIPRFIRITDHLQTTSTHKFIKYPLREAGIDLNRIPSTDKIFYFDRLTSTFRHMDQEAFEKINRGEITF